MRGPSRRVRQLLNAPNGIDTLANYGMDVGPINRKVKNPAGPWPAKPSPPPTPSSPTPNAPHPSSRMVRAPRNRRTPRYRRHTAGSSLMT